MDIVCTLIGKTDNQFLNHLNHSYSFSSNKLEREKILEYDLCPHREYLVVVSHKVKSFQYTGSFATGS